MARIKGTKSQFFCKNLRTPPVWKNSRTTTAISSYFSHVPAGNSSRRSHSSARIVGACSELSNSSPGSELHAADNTSTNSRTPCFLPGFSSLSSHFFKRSLSSSRMRRTGCPALTRAPLPTLSFFERIITKLSLLLLPDVPSHPNVCRLKNILLAVQNVSLKQCRNFSSRSTNRSRFCQIFEEETSTTVDLRYPPTSIRLNPPLNPPPLLIRSPSSK